MMNIRFLNAKNLVLCRLGFSMQANFLRIKSYNILMIKSVFFPNLFNILMKNRLKMKQDSNQSNKIKKTELHNMNY